MTTQNSLFHAMYASYKLHIKVKSSKVMSRSLNNSEVFPRVVWKGPAQEEGTATPTPSVVWVWHQNARPHPTYFPYNRLTNKFIPGKSKY